MCHISKDLGDRTSAGPFFGRSTISQHAFVWDANLCLEPILPVATPVAALWRKTCKPYTDRLKWVINVSGLIGLWPGVHRGISQCHLTVTACGFCSYKVEALAFPTKGRSWKSDRNCWSYNRLKLVFVIFMQPQANLWLTVSPSNQNIFANSFLCQICHYFRIWKYKISELTNNDFMTLFSWAG